MTALFNLMAGKKIGHGIHRDVYEFDWDNKLVLKVAHNHEGRGANSFEYHTWEKIKDGAAAKWLAPCYGISFNGKYLLQAKAEMGRKRDYPEKIPAFFTDRKYTNFGWIGDQLVCVDYASALNLFQLRRVSNLVKANWWE